MLSTRRHFLIGILLMGIKALSPACGQERSFDALFPFLNAADKATVFSSGGLIISIEGQDGLRLGPASALGSAVVQPVLAQHPGFLVEALLVIPQTETKGFVQVYNALSKIRNLKGRLYHSATRDKDIPLFEDATRITGVKKTSLLPDPPDAHAVPLSETIYIRLKDVNFGNSYYRADLTRNQQSLQYTLANVKTISYLFIPVMKEGKFIAHLYFEPLAEGIVLYSIAGADVSDFVASQVDIPSAIRKRLEVIIGWVVEGITQAP
ncbi:MAG: hypothetical protein LBU17_08935 [Treponema sp.]|jgi:hypothetical protein|nr:hypothetical protein [Treponema sp.]